MARAKTFLKLGAALWFASGAFTGCKSTDGSSSEVSAGIYDGVGADDPWYYGGAYYPPDVVVTPPPGVSAPPPRPEQPIYDPSPPRPVQLPSIPVAPRPALHR